MTMQVPNEDRSNDQRSTMEDVSNNSEAAGSSGGGGGVLSVVVGAPGNDAVKDGGASASINGISPVEDGDENETAATENTGDIVESGVDGAGNDMDMDGTDVNDHETRKQSRPLDHSESTADQPTVLAEHSSLPQAPEVDTPSPAQQDIKANQSTSHHDTNKDTSHVPRDNIRSIYNSAPVSVLGNDSDRNDFIRGGAPTSLPRKEHPSEVEVAASEGSGNVALTKLKQWFASPPESADDDYHNFQSPTPKEGQKGESPNNKKEGVRKLSRDDNGYDVKFLNEEEEGEGDVELAGSTKTAPKRMGWRESSQKPLPGTEEEERVMGECSFFYDMDNNDEEDGTAKRLPSHRIPEIESQTTDIDNLDEDEASTGYAVFEQQHPHYRARRLNPRAMAHAIKTQAKRRWTERRYRRRLRQSQLGMTGRSWSNEPQSYNSQQPGEDEFTYELTTEHRRAFQAAHAALNGQLANEYGRNRHAIRRQFGYEYDIDYDLELGEEGNINSNGDGADDEIRADLTKSSLSIRGSGLIRMPTDNVRLVCDQQLQPGILSIETRDVVGSGGVVGYENYGNANRYGNIHGSGMFRSTSSSSDQGKNGNQKNGKKEHQQNNGGKMRRSSSKESISQEWRRSELAYVLTVDEQIYQRVAREMGDAYRIPCGMYYCCHGDTDGHGDHVGIGVAVVIMLVVFAFFIAGMIAWPTW